VGFDGFVDEIVTPVAARHGPGEDHAPFASIAEFAERVGAAGRGRNANIEIVPRLEKLGGNGPILADGLLALGCDVRYIGALGAPDVHPLFVDFARATHAVSLANPGRTMAFGDHFNAGYLFGRNAGLLPSKAIRVGALVATAYVTNGFSPDVDRLKT
jgi:sugar/nucleoside kinase (ribokinase family)